MARLPIRLLLALLALTASFAVGAQEPGALPGVVARPLQDGGQSWTLSVQTLVLLTAMAFLPAVLLMMTGFTRIIINPHCTFTGLIAFLESCAIEFFIPPYITISVTAALLRQ